MYLFYGVPIVKMPLYHHALLFIAMVDENPGAVLKTRIHPLAGRHPGVSCSEIRQ
jgi:hypothetical protein